MPFDAAAARKDGVSDAQIADYLAQKAGFDVAKARNDNVPDSQIVDYLAPKIGGQARQAPQQSPLEAIGSAGGAVASNTMENLKDAATQTGEAISNPTPGMPAVLQRAGQMGNALQGVGQAAMAPIAGAATAAVEPFLPAASRFIKNNLVPDDLRFQAIQPGAAAHRVARGVGSDLATAAGLGMAANTGRAAMLERQGLPPEPTPLQKFAGNQASGGANVQPTPPTPPAPPLLTAKDLKAASGASYEQMRNAGATLNSGAIDKVNTSINQALKDSGLMNARLHGDTLSVIDDLRKDTFTGNMDLEKLDQYRQLLGQVVTDNTTKLEGMNQDALKANVAMQAIDKAVDSLGAGDLSKGTPQAVGALNQARDLYSASARMRTVQGIIDNASMTDNPATAIRTGFKALAKQVNASPRGWNKAEVAAINHAAHTGVVTGALKFMGSRLISSMSGAIAGAAGGGAVGAGLGMVAGAAAGTPFRAGATALQTRRANAVSGLVLSRPNVQAALKNLPANAGGATGVLTKQMRGKP